MTWLNTANTVNSKGLTTKKAKNLASLAARREETQSQYFTPQWVAAGMWSIAQPAMTSKPGIVSVMDNSIGSGRLLAHANPEKHILFGCDIDERSIQALSDDARAAGLTYELSHSGMENVTFNNMGAAFINPPFSITLSSPNLFPFNCTTYGLYGKNTNALSQQYSLEQALFAAPLVVALMPNSMREFCYANKRLVAEIQLPNDAFIDEGANVSTCVYVFGHKDNADAVQKLSVNKGDVWPVIEGLKCHFLSDTRPSLKLHGIDTSKPTITLPVTHNNSVTLHHHYRRIILGFECGFTQAKVENAILREAVEMPTGRTRHRYPSAIKYTGSPLLLLDVHLAQDDPEQSFMSLIDIINTSGGQALITPTLAGYWKNIQKRLLRDAVPFRKTVKQATTPTVSLIAKRSMLLEQCNTKSPVIRKGETIEAEALGGVYLVKKDGWLTEYNRDKLQTLFDISGEDERVDSDWKVVYEGKNKAFPIIHKQNLAILDKHFPHLWKPQADSVSEAMMTRGNVLGWQQGTGKARAAIALCMTSTAKHNLIVVESGLVDEMLREFSKLNLAPGLWQVIRSVSDIDTLKKVNIISYNKLKTSIGTGKQTISHKLRRRFGLVAADEGGILSNYDSLQSRALLRLAPRKLFLLDGTPMGNYPRDTLPLACATSGSSTVTQPYSLRNGLKLEKRLVNSGNHAERGIEGFKNDYVVLDWASNQFQDSLKDGAKREIPSIKDIPLFRQWAGKFVQRRLRNEPEMIEFTGVPDPNRETKVIDWDSAHFNHYLRVAVEFSEWFIKEKDLREKGGKGCNLVATLARIGAVIAAANHPHDTTESPAGAYTPLTSKQRMVLADLAKVAKRGEKAILYAYSPSMLSRLHAELAKMGIRSVLFTGQQNIKNRNLELDQEFRFGSAPILLSSWVGQRGLNLPQANNVFLYNRHWSGDTEEQAVSRVLRPDQSRPVFVTYYALKGSIDEYMGQVADFKVAAADAGLDFGDGATEIENFMHLDSVLEKFCRETLEMSVYELHRHALCA